MDTKDTIAFIMLKPDAVGQGLTKNIVTYFTKAGFLVDTFQILRATKEQLAAHYKEVFEKYGSAFQVQMETYFAEDYVVPILLRLPSGCAIGKARQIIGATNPAKAEPGTIRGDLSTDSFEACAKENRALRNLVHASDSPEAVRREMKIWLDKEEI